MTKKVSLTLPKELRKLKGGPRRIIGLQDIREAEKERNLMSKADLSKCDKMKYKAKILKPDRPNFSVFICTTERVRQTSQS